MTDRDKQSVDSPINADGTEIEDAGRTHHHIQSDKDVTVDLAEAPLSHYLEEKNIDKWHLTATANCAQTLHLPNKSSSSVEMMCFPSTAASKPDSRVSLYIFSGYYDAGNKKKV